MKRLALKAASLAFQKAGRQVELLLQVEYYFSVQNLCRDIFLRSKMDDEGWIAGSVIAGFNRVRMLTPDLAVIVSALADSSTVELSPDGLLLRPRDNWRNWVLPVEQRDPTAHAPSIYPTLSGASGSNASDRYTQRPPGVTATNR